MFGTTLLIGAPISAILGRISVKRAKKYIKNIKPDGLFNSTNF